MDKFEERLVIAEQRIANIMAEADCHEQTRYRENAYIESRIRELEKTVWRGVGTATAIMVVMNAVTAIAVKLIK